jgi:RNA polymerase sigma factor (sigma-70 family)
MTDSHELLVEYSKTGSESAFRELISRYSNLVYSTALRLVGGDTHLAEDVAQTVFMGLASRGRALSTGVMLGGWLHQHTYHVAMKTMRADRRRQSREREAVGMNTLQNDVGADWREVAPILDEAITQLGSDDRTAILLRFFEQRDFRSVGKALGSDEDAARMRVNRALEKLHSLLQHRGVTLSVAALGTALATEAVTAAPAGFAGSAAATALASAAAGTATTLGVLKSMTLAKLILGAAGVGVAVVLVGLLYHGHQYLGGQPAENTASQAICIDLSQHYTARLTDSLNSPSTLTENNLATLPKGRKVFSGVPFQVGGLLQLSGRKLQEWGRNEYPESITGIVLGKPCQRLHLLHGAGGVYDRENVTIAKLVLHYADQSTREIEIKTGVHVRDWWGDPRQKITGNNSKLTWTGTNPALKNSGGSYPPSLRIYKTTFENPQPGSLITTFDYVSTMRYSSPFLIALTVE